MKLALGTVQFGLNYGVANTHGQTSLTEATAIVEEARRAGIDTLDTAIGYGDSEQRLGEIGVEGWKIVSKLPAVPDDVSDMAAWAEDSVRASLARLKVQRLYGLLMHRSSDLAGGKGRGVFTALEKLKSKGLIDKVGVSIYDPIELDAIVPDHPVDIVQAPFNVVDRRIVTSGWLDRLVQKNIEIHTRSAFLQGLLLMRQKEQAARFTEWTHLWALWHEWLGESGLSPLQGALGFAVSQPGIERVVVGVDILGQLKGILEAANSSIQSVPAAIAINDQRLINPSNWKQP